MKRGPNRQRRSFFGRALATLLLILLAGCPMPLFTAPHQMPGAVGDAAAIVPPIEGRVALSAFKAQLTTIDEVSAGATVALIDAASGQSLASTVTDPSGAFRLTFTNKFRPATGRVYYLEAIKGLKAGTDVPNRVGSPLARIRTIISYRPGWVSVNSSVSGGGVGITPVTTALSIIAALRAAAGSPVTMLDLIGSLPETDDPGSFTQEARTGITRAGIRSATEVVNEALRLDRDPFRSVLLDVSSPDLNSFVLPKSSFTIAFFSPSSAAIGEDLFVVGDNFDAVAANNLVTFAGSGGTRLAVQVLDVSPDRSRLKVRVPVGATNGPVSVQVGDLLLLSPVPFQLAARDGHSIVDDFGNLYVSNYAFGTISMVSPLGVTTPLVSGLSNPRGLTLGPDGMLYVANGDGKIYRIDPAKPTQPFWTTFATGASGAWGLAFAPTGELYVSLETSDKITRVVAGSLQLVTASGLSQPRGLSFGPDRKLYVANYGNDTIAGVDPATGATSTYQSGFSRPWSLAFDTYGVMYVTNNAGNSVYTVGTDGVVRSFASVQSPGGIDAAPSGYLYVADNASNRIYRIDTAGYSGVLAEGASYPKGLAAASDGTFYVANAQNHTVIRIKPDGSVSTLARGFNDPAGLALDEPRGILYVANGGNGTIGKVSIADGSVTTCLRNFSNLSGIAYWKDRLYVYQPVSKDGATTYTNLAEVHEYDLTQTPAAFVRAIRSPLRNPQGIAKDPRAIATVYVTQPLENFVAKIDPATGRMSRFADTAPSPEDVAVDAGGYVYVACKGTGTSDHGIQVFDPNGQLLSTLTDRVNRPTAIAYDPTTQDVFFGNGANGVTNGGSIKRISTSDRTTVCDVVAGGAQPLTNPTGIAFNGPLMLVAHSGQVLRVDGYATAPVLSLAFNRGSVTDVELDASGNVYTITGSGLIKSAMDGSFSIPYAANIMGGSRRLAWGTGGNLYVTGLGSPVYQGNAGVSCRWQGLSNSFSTSLFQGPLTPALAVGTSGGKDWLLVTSAGYWHSGLMKINLDPNASEFYQVGNGGDSDGPRGAAFDPATGKAWAVTGVKAGALRFNAAHTSVEAQNSRDMSYIGYGAAFWNGALYAAIHSHHRIDRFDGANPASVTTLPSGIGGPEI